MNRRSLSTSTSGAAGAVAAAGGQSVQAGPTFRRPKTIIPVPAPSPKFQRVEDGVPDTQLTREAQHASAVQPFSPRLLLGK
jgi:hypothetical protein